MHSYQFSAYGAPLARVEVADPRPEGTEVLLRVLGCGVCHSDVHVWEGHYDLGDDRKLDVRGGRTLPFTLGHEIAGEVVATGPEADVAVGDRRVVFPWIGCGACAVCAGGDEHLCLSPRGLGTFRDGGFSDRVVVPHPRYLFDFGSTPADLACTYACSGLASYSALAKATATHTGPVVILGAGGVGLAGVAIAKATSDREVVVVDVSAAKLEAAVRLGADHVVDATDAAAPKALRRFTGGGAGVIVDCAGSASSATLGLRSLARSGTLVIVGMLGGSLEVALPLMPLKDLTIRGSYLGSLREMGDLMQLVREGRVAPIPIEPRPLERAQASLDDLSAGRIVGRVVLEP